MIHSRYSVVIVGAGIAGSIAALRLSELRPDLSILMISKGALSECSSQLAQGGIAIPCADVEGDLESHFHDTLVAGNMKGDPHTVREILVSAPKFVAYLEGLGIDFDRTSDDHYHYVLEGGHYRPRVIHTSDATGATIMSTVHEALGWASTITVREGMRLIALRYNDDDQWVLEINHSASNKTYVVHARYVILAMGGSGNAFGYSSNLPTAIGDAVNLAMSLDLPLKDLQWMQFHPTLLVTSGDQASRPLITEALRGAGAYLVNNKGQRFVKCYDERGELAPRDVVSAAMIQEMERTETDHVYLDCRHLSTVMLSRRFPGFLDLCSRELLDPSTDLIPVRPGAHYQCGGIDAGCDGKTSQQGLFAIGECARTGMHGSNRLASNSLLEAGVTALNAAECISTTAPPMNSIVTEAPSPERQNMGSDSTSDPYLHAQLRELRLLLHRVALDESKHRHIESLAQLVADIETKESTNAMNRNDLHDARTLAGYARAYLQAIESHQQTTTTA